MYLLARHHVKVVSVVIRWNNHLLRALKKDYWGARGVMVMDTATRVQILDKTDCISHSTNTLGKGMNPIILPPAMGK